MSNPNLSDVKVRLGQHAKAALVEIADRRELKLSDIMREAVRFYLSKQETKPQPTEDK